MPHVPRTAGKRCSTFKSTRTMKPNLSPVEVQIMECLRADSGAQDM